ncbi:MAG: hypothetical protein M3Z23_04005 [Acidobacteriota bacterium]|nr:hypothetical protein [Acidobacteriota bacterium]
MAVIDGKAKVPEDDQSIELKKGKETDGTEPLHPVKFDRKQKDDLYNGARFVRTICPKRAPLPQAVT